MTPIFRNLLFVAVGFLAFAGAAFLMADADADLHPDPIPGGKPDAGGYDNAPDTMPEYAAKVALGNNANAILSLDLIADGGAGNRRDDGVTTGAVSGRGTKIALEVFATGVATTLRGVILRFDFDASLVSFVRAENSAFALSLPEGSVGAGLAATSPVTLAPTGFLARAEFETVADVTGREFSIGIEKVTISESAASSDDLRTTRVIAINATASPDFDGDNFVGFTDFLIFAGAYGSRQGDGRYNAAQDLDSDGSIDFADFLIFAGSYGGPPPSTGGGGDGNPDLVVQSPSVSNSRVSSGAVFTLGATVRNQGNGSSASTTLHYYRSTDATVSTSDTQVGSDAVSGLSAGSSSAESINLTAPSTAGTYYYGACVDAVSGESNTGNNCSPAVSLTVATAPPPPTGTSKLYWTDWGTDKIQRANLDGSGVEDLVSGGGLRGPDGLTLDTAGGKMYWTDAGANKIQRADLSGANVEDLVTGLGIPYGLALDLSGGKMYWTNRQTNKIQRADLSGSNVEDLITSGLTFPGGLALDVSGRKMYWTNPGANRIQRSNLDGSGVEDLVTSGVISPTGIALDVSGGKMYWTDRRSDKIQRSNLNGSAVEDLVTSGLRSPNGLALDVSGGKMYWADEETNKVQRANLDGSNVEDLVSGSDGLVDPSSVALETASGSGGRGPGPGGGGGGRPSADLVVETPSVSNNSPTAGSSLTLSATVRNRGNGPSAATTLRYFSSADPTISTSDTEVGTDAVGGLAAWGSSAESIDLTAPSSAGTYYYGACVDAVSGESDTGNNCSPAVTVKVVTAPAPDLVVDAPTVSTSSPDTGATFTLSATVRNPGNGPSAATTLRYFSSSDATISASDTEVGADAVGGLAAWGSSAESIDLTAPSSAGTYYYGACVDAVSGESDTGNNCSPAVTVTVVAAPVPDLVVDAPTVSNSCPTAGASFTLNATVRNQGNGRSSLTTLRYYRSTDATVSTSDTEVGTDLVSSLSASGASAEGIILTAPSSAGTYYYGACVDAVSSESDTGNNCSPGVTVTVVAAPAPDLVLDAPTVSTSSPDTGATFTLSATVRNRGNGPSAATTLRYFSSSDATISASDTEVGTDAVGGLAASGSSAESIDLTAPSSAGTYYYGACVDAVSGESDTGNNCSASVSLTVSTPPPATETWKLYWTDGNTGEIRRSNLDGSGVEDLVDLVNSASPSLMALDVSGGKIYWTVPGADKIQRSNLDGSGIEDLVTSGLDVPFGIALDVSGGKMYWTDAGTDKIQRSNLDGSGVEDLITGLDSPRGIALDVTGGKIYWTDSGSDKVQRSNLDGSSIEDLVTSGLDSPFGIALDVSGGKMYWADGGTWERASGAKIQRSNLDGSGVEDLVTSGFIDPFGIALDVAGGKIYWTDAFDKIQRSNLDGSGLENLITGLFSPRGIAVGLVSDEAGDGSGGGDPTPPATAVTGSITDCSFTYSNFIYAIRIAGTVRASRTVTNLTLTGFVGGTFVGTAHLGTLSAGQTENFTVSGISGTQPSGECRVSMEWTEWGSQSRTILKEH